MSDLFIGNLLAQATSAVLIDDQVAGTAWLVSEEGNLLTAGHVLGIESPLSEVNVKFSDNIPRKAYKIQVYFHQKMRIDFAVLKLVDMPLGRQPLPISLTRNVSGRFIGYSKSLSVQTVGVGKFVGLHGEDRHRHRTL